MGLIWKMLECILRLKTKTRGQLQQATNKYDRNCSNTLSKKSTKATRPLQKHLTIWSLPRATSWISRRCRTAKICQWLHRWSLHQSTCVSRLRLCQCSTHLQSMFNHWHRECNRPIRQWSISLPLVSHTWFRIAKLNKVASIRDNTCHLACLCRLIGQSSKLNKEERRRLPVKIRLSSGSLYWSITTHRKDVSHTWTIRSIKGSRNRPTRWSLDKVLWTAIPWW